MLHPIAEQARLNGLIGAGGAGFPTHIKLASQAEYVIANAAECEPLLHKDKELIKTKTADLVNGLKMAVAATDAKYGVIAVKQKYQDVVQLMKQAISGENLSLHLMGDFYPAGDEQVLVYEVTGRVVPPAGIPIQVGAVVQNVETLINLAQPVPVTDKYLTVTGAVNSPGTFKVPIGVSFGELLQLAGGTTVSPLEGGRGGVSPLEGGRGGVALLVGGAMMGYVSEDLTEPVTKVTGGLIVLPKEHHLIQRKTLSYDKRRKIGQSCCDQCTDCTEICPRYLLGHPLYPHLVMRSLGFAKEQAGSWNQSALLCCLCNLCTLYACPENLDPGGICAYSRHELLSQGIHWKNNSHPLTPHPMREYRRVPMKKLIQRLGLASYDTEAPLRDVAVEPAKVIIRLQQGIGAPAQATVKVGDAVKKGMLIGEIPAGKLGSRVHASINGIVTSVTEQAIVIQR